MAHDPMTDVCAVILAGGSGTRFWPLSRESHPKQMLQIVGEDSLLKETIKRIHGFVPAKNIWIVTTEDKAQDIRFHIDSLGSLAKEIRFINEPRGRNTAPAIGLAAICLNQISPESMMVVLPSDHAIPDTEKFLEDLKLAVQGAEEDYLVTFGIKPIRPETGYGYIKVIRSSRTKPKRLPKVEGFFEKPDLKTAKRYLSHGGYFWNSGIFVFRTSKILSEIEKFAPSLYRTLRSIPASAIPAFSTVEGRVAWSEQYGALEPISIDYAVMERSRDILMVPARFRWSDLGSWAALDEVIEKDKTGNIVRGNAINIGNQNSTVFAGARLVATIGLKDMVVVDTPDATLVTPKERVQEVRKIVEALKQNDREEHLIHKTVERPWGSYTVLEKGDRYKIKRVVLKPKAKLSLQLHRRRSEHWVVVSGVAKVTRDNETYLAHTNESTYIPVNTRHRLENPEEVPLQIIEVQNGEYLEEDDIERFADDYGRQ
ncbi:MAG TPA: mannose-1-phosphate guanylyltransferase/mannose-6-phosphate isomerase [Thermodesulfobacteriota bacterium]|nr:mannose-1-phosphate guanylyltransferase/mannose-6-phosphate isomerase [Thermodesulfobacteriota bacterium]